MRAILAAFPGAVIQEVRDSRADAYGLAAEPDPAMSDAAPADAEPGEPLDNE